MLSCHLDHFLSKISANIYVWHFQVEWSPHLNVNLKKPQDVQMLHFSTNINQRIPLKTKENSQNVDTWNVNLNWSVENYKFGASLK